MKNVESLMNIPLMKAIHPVMDTPSMWPVRWTQEHLTLPNKTENRGFFKIAFQIVLWMMKNVGPFFSVLVNIIGVLHG